MSEDVLNLVVNVRRTELPRGRLHYVMPDGTGGSAEGLLEEGIPIPNGARPVLYDAPPALAEGSTISIGVVGGEAKKQEQAK